MAWIWTLLSCSTNRNESGVENGETDLQRRMIFESYAGCEVTQRSSTFLFQQLSRWLLLCLSFFWCESMGTGGDRSYSTIAWEAGDICHLYAILLWEEAEAPLYSPATFPHQQACQSVEGGRTHRAVLPPLAQVCLEGQGLHREAWKVGKHKNWGGHQERNRPRSEWEIRGKTESRRLCLGRHWWCRVDLPDGKKTIACRWPGSVMVLPQQSKALGSLSQASPGMGKGITRVKGRKPMACNRESW